MARQQKLSMVRHDGTEYYYWLQNIYEQRRRAWSVPIEEPYNVLGVSRYDEYIQIYYGHMHYNCPCYSARYKNPGAVILDIQTFKLVVIQQIVHVYHAYKSVRNTRLLNVLQDPSSAQHSTSMDKA